MKREVLMEDIRNMEEALERTASRTDIWQDRIIHAIAKAVYHILMDKVKETK